eukprot:TRINITY_DN309_c0_g1_i1.p1 TRINITY_DN309_c0_g1~~TRINITY_DN309_c0_g1_i1.p1  ORF type:complete len:711 (+),score=273.52 TRINITY_DN309_c0_g1_i1:372-2504(+)
MKGGHHEAANSAGSDSFPRSRRISSIAPHTLAVGKHVKFSGHAMDCDRALIHGAFHGYLEASAVCVRRGGVLECDGTVDALEVGGTATGAGLAADLLVVRKTGSVGGELRYGQLASEQGAHIDALSVQQIDSDFAAAWDSEPNACEDAHDEVQRFLDYREDLVAKQQQAAPQPPPGEVKPENRSSCGSSTQEEEDSEDEEESSSSESSEEDDEVDDDYDFDEDATNSYGQRPDHGDGMSLSTIDEEPEMLSPSWLSSEARSHRGADSGFAYNPALHEKAAVASAPASLFGSAREKTIIALSAQNSDALLATPSRAVVTAAKASSPEVERDSRSYSEPLPSALSLERPRAARQPPPPLQAPAKVPQSPPAQSPPPQQPMQALERRLQEQANQQQQQMAEKQQQQQQQQKPTVVPEQHHHAAEARPRPRAPQHGSDGAAPWSEPPELQLPPSLPHRSAPAAPAADAALIETLELPLTGAAGIDVAAFIGTGGLRDVVTLAAQLREAALGVAASGGDPKLSEALVAAVVALEARQGHRLDAKAGAVCAADLARLDAKFKAEDDKAAALAKTRYMGLTASNVEDAPRSVQLKSVNKAIWFLGPEAPAMALLLPRSRSDSDLDLTAAKAAAAAQGPPACDEERRRSLSEPAGPAGADELAEATVESLQVPAAVQLKPKASLIRALGASVRKWAPVGIKLQAGGGAKGAVASAGGM